MKVLLTGATGFLGKYIHKSLVNDHEVVTLGRGAENQLKHDITNLGNAQLPSVELVIHAAGKAHSIPKTEKEKQEFFHVNFQGTVNILDALDRIDDKPKQFVLISTVAVYGKESGSMISEIIKPEGNSPYAQSKLLAEEAVRKWGIKNGINVLILRLPLIAGINPPGNLGSLIKAIDTGYYFRIGKGENKKSVVLAKDIGKFIVECFTINASGVFNLTDGVNPTLAELDSYIGDKLGKKIKIMPYRFMNLVARLADLASIPFFSSSKLEKLTGELTFDCTKAKTELGWNPSPAVNNFLEDYDQ